jgi:hypothetical protein
VYDGLLAQLFFIFVIVNGGEVDTNNPIHVRGCLCASHMPVAKFPLSKYGIIEFS